jgi:hypothetical protein
MEKKKGRMDRVYTDGKKPAPESKIKGGGKMPERGMKGKTKTPKMGG